MTAELQNALLIHNPKAGNGGSARRRLLDQARHIFAARGIDADLADHQNGHRVPLALLPGGTSNILAKELDLPWDIPKAAEKLVHGTVKEIALGLATPLEEPEKKKYFLSVAGAGPDGAIVYSINLGLKRSEERRVGKECCCRSGMER